MKTYLSILLFLCLIALSNAKEEKRQFDLSADVVQAQNDIVEASGNAFILYNDVYATADKIIYNRVTQIAHLRGKVKIYQGDILYLDTQEISISLKDNQVSMTNLYLQSTTGMWVMAKAGDGDTKNGQYHFKRGVISGCDIQHPLWHLNVSSGTYNDEKSYMSVWNPRFYVMAVPVFYLPYFVAPTYNVRKSGLLSPELSMSNKQGLMFMLPLFIAPFNRWDMTLSPQIRTSRGYGGAVEFRFADKNNAIVSFQARYFQNSDEYVLENNLKNQGIFGATLQYETKRIFTSKENTDVKDGFFINATYMNDLEYMRLKSLNTSFNTRLYESRINYFVNSQNHFFGSYVKYYLDLSKASNSDTFQTLPHLQYHHYTDSLFFRNLLYSFDAQSKYITRQSGYRYFHNTFSLPIGLHIPLFDDYISIGANTDFTLTSVALQNAQYILDASSNQTVSNSINYGLGSYNISINSDLAKAYKSLFHTIHFEALFSGAMFKYTSDAISDDTYKAYNTLLERGVDAEALLQYWNPSDMVDIIKNKHKVDLKFSQYFYGSSGKELFYWRVYQRIFLNDSYLTNTQVLRNEFGFSPIEGLNLNTSLFFSYVRRTISEASINANFNRWGLNANLTYYFKLDPIYLTSGLYSTQDNTGFARGRVGYDFGYFQLNANVGYDAGLGYLKDWYVTISKDIRCFGIGIKIAQDIRPTLTADNTINPITNQYIKLEFRFVPLTNTGLTYRFKE